jgi:hypothetical protein
MQVTLDLIGDSDSHTPADVLLTGEHTERGDVLRITLPAPHREIVLNRAELYRALGEVWRPE